MQIRDIIPTFPAGALIVVRIEGGMVELEIDNHTAAALAVALACMAWPVLVKFLLPGVIIGMYAVATCPRTAVQP